MEISSFSVEIKDKIASYLPFEKAIEFSIYQAKIKIFNFKQIDKICTWICAAIDGNFKIIKLLHYYNVKGGDQNILYYTNKYKHYSLEIWLLQNRFNKKT